MIKLNEKNKNDCEGLVTEEVKLVIKNMKNKKSSGMDGFPIKFYKFFWRDFGTFLIHSFKESYHNGELSITQKQGIITSLPKGNKPREFLNNKRSISFLNVDFKIFSGVMALRMKKILPFGYTQKGFLKDRYRVENVRLVYDITSTLKIFVSKGLLILLDFEKAFDSLEWSYIKNIVQAYNFEKDLVQPALFGSYKLCNK